MRIFVVNKLIMGIWYIIFSLQIRGGYRNSPKGRGYSDRVKMKSELLFTGNWA